MAIFVGTRTLLAKTCVRCRKFKQRCDFGLVRPHKNGPRYPNAWCLWCVNEATKAKNVNNNDRSKLTATQHRTEWTGADFKLYEALEAQGLSAVEIAKQMGRSCGAIYSRRNKMKAEADGN